MFPQSFSDQTIHLTGGLGHDMTLDWYVTFFLKVDSIVQILLTFYQLFNPLDRTLVFIERRDLF